MNDPRSVIPGIPLFPLVMLFLFLAGNSTTMRAQRSKLAPSDTLQPVTVGADRRITFRVYAPHAERVKLGGTDIPERARKDTMKRNPDGVWTVTVGPLPSGAYRYNYIIDDVSVIDPRNPVTSESNMNPWSLVYVPGSDLTDVRNVPHGVVAEVTYFSTALQRLRRMHMYTPPGYESGCEKFPVFYLLHGAYDTDDAWTSVGRAGQILDNLIAEGKAVPMLVVMPAGHTGPFPPLTPPSPGMRRDEFAEDFTQDIRPYVEKHYRVYTDRGNRAIAGLSMGGAQALDIAAARNAEYSYIGVYSSGIFELGDRGPFRGPVTGASWEERNRKFLGDSQMKKGLHLFWFATGKDDFLLETSRRTVALFRRHGFDVVYRETSGGHTWINWREYLAEFVPLLFRKHSD